MKKNGFTLVELLAVIVIIGILVVLVTPKLIGELENTKEDALNGAKQLVVSVANSYISDRNSSFPVSISVSELCNNGYLKCDGNVLKIDDDTVLNGYVIGNTSGELYYSNTITTKQITNLIQNGNFNNSDNWDIPSDNTYIISNNIYIGYNKLSNANFFEQNINTIQNHIYYSSSYIKNSGNVRIGYISNKSNACNNDSCIAVAPNSYMAHVSKMFTSNFSNGYFVVQNALSDQEVTINAKNLVMVDLTSAFGSGNEPNIGWCDKNIEYFNGTKNIYVGD